MIELHRPAGPSALADRVESELDALVVGHRVLVVDSDESPRTRLPVVREGDRVVGPDEIPAYLDELRRLMADWRRFQSDACYVADDGEVC